MVVTAVPLAWGWLAPLQVLWLVYTRCSHHEACRAAAPCCVLQCSRTSQQGLAHMPDWTCSS